MNSTQEKFIMMPENSLTSRRHVLTYNLQQREDEILITLMTIYDKSDIDNVSDAYIRSLVQQKETPDK